MTVTERPSSESQARHGQVELSIVIVNYNVKEFVEQALVSIRKALAGIRAEIIVVDNASSDGSQQLIREKFPEVNLTANQANLGFAKSSNIGLRQATGQFLLLLNPDTIVQEDTFSELLRFFRQNPDAGMVGCKVLNPDGTLQLACRRSFPTPWVAFTKLSGLSRLWSGSKLFGRYNLTFLDPDKTYEVEALSGSFMMVRRETMEQVGLLDESFFMYGEDLDWCYRVGQSQWKVIYHPGTQIIHFKGESSKKAQFDSLRVFYKAMGLFARKHFRHRYLLMPYWIIWMGIWLRGGLSFLSGLVKASAAPAFDLLLLFASVALSIQLRFDSLEHLDRFIPVIAAYSLIWMSLLTMCGSYTRDTFSSSKAAMAILAGFVVNASLTFFFKQYAFSRAVVLLSGGVCFLAIPGWRLMIKMLARTRLLPFKGTLGKTLLARNTLIVGDLDSGEKLIQKLNSQVDSGYDICGLISTNGVHTGEIRCGVEVLGALGDLNQIIARNYVQEVIFSTHQLSYDQIMAIIANSGQQRVNFKLIPSNLDVIIGKASIDRIDDVPLLEIDYKLHKMHYRGLKRVIDAVLAFFIVVATLPLILGKKYLSSSMLETVTVAGCANPIVLRRFAGKARPSRFDRLPYLWAVLRGDLSFVGRELDDGAATSSTSKSSGLALKPGLTGLVQVNSQKQLSVDDKTKYEIYYLKNYSPLLDLEIIFKAIFRI